MYKKNCFLWLAFVLISQSLLADSVFVKGQASVEYETGIFSSEPEEDYVRSAISQAKQNAWKKYVSTFNASMRNVYSKYQGDIDAQVDDFIITHQLIDKSLDEDAKILTLLINAEIDNLAVQTKINQYVPKIDGNGEYLAFLFVTRQQSEIKSFDDRVTKKSLSKESVNASEKLAGSSNNLISQDKKVVMSENTTGGSTLRKSDKVNWQLADSKTINVAINQTLVDSGYSPIQFGEIRQNPSCGSGPSEEDIKQEYSKSVSLSSKTLSEMNQAAKNCKVKFTAIGSLDILQQKIDPVTGKTLVTVSVTAQVFNTDGMFTRTIGSVGPIQYQGLGDHELDARNNALIKAANDAAYKIVNQLGNK